uniref:alpha-1,2-Mannosidase n=1 Tax=Sarcoptes scabiei TaxID=52283 RepID=A0A834VBH7_SARSC
MFQRNSSGLLLGPPNPRSVLRIREKYLFFSVIIAFMIISLIAMTFLPELKTSNVILQYIKPAESLGPQLLGLVPDDRQQITAVLPPPRSRFEDEVRLREKIQQHFNLSQEAVIPKPNIQNEKRQSSDSHSALIDKSSDFSIRRLKNWTLMIMPDGEDSDSEIQKRREKVREMMIVAWDSYRKYAWGENELKPISKKGHSPGIFGNTKLGATIIDGMDTLFIMGLMDRFNEGRDWIEKNLDFTNIKSEMSVFEVIIRYVGGLLTCHAFTNDKIFLKKAIEITNLMLPAFDTPTGVPHALIKPALGSSRNYVWASQGNSILSEIGTLSLEFSYLSALTGDRTYYNHIDRIRTLLDSLEKPEGLYPNYINPRTGKFGQKHISVGALGDSFYEYLLKYWLMSNKHDTTSLRMYNEAVEAIDKRLVQKSPGNLVYLADLRYERIEHKMGHLACFAAGMFALGAKEQAHNQERAEHFLQLGTEIANTCHESYVRTKTKIGPENFWFTGTLEAEAGKKNEMYYILRPEVIEGWFYLWRLTKNPKYRQWAWDAVEAIERNCLVPDRTGYSGIKNVNDEKVQHDDVQQSFFLAETLKYLYLIFSDDQLIPLDQWVMNSEGHPLPIKNHNPAYTIENSDEKQIR